MSGIYYGLSVAAILVLLFWFIRKDTADRAGES